MTSAVIASPLYLAIDQGGHASRALVFDINGRLVCQSERPITTQTPQPDWVEHDPDEMLSSICEAMAEVVDMLGTERQRLTAAGMATQRSSIICWDKLSGKPLSPIISWQDRRQQQWLTQFEPQRAEIHQRTGLFLSPHYGASKLRWCLDNLPAVKQARQQQRLAMGPMASYLIYHLTMEKQCLTDPGNASRTLLWNIHCYDWDPKLLTLFGLETAILPQCRLNRDAFGTLAIKDLKLPLTVVSGDQPAALFAFGEPGRDHLYINIGTGAFIQKPVAQAVSTERLLSGVAFADKQRRVFTVEGTVNGAARALQQHAEEHQIADIEQQLPHWLTTTTNPPLFLNGVAGLGSPYWRADFNSRFISDDDTTNHQTKAVAIVESIAFLIQRNIEAMQEECAAARQIIISGGLARLDGLVQRIADLSRTTVLRPRQSEATAAGLAFLVASQPDNWPSLLNSDHFIPGPAEALDSRYGRWRRLMFKETGI